MHALHLLYYHNGLYQNPLLKIASIVLEAYKNFDREFKIVAGNEPEYFHELCFQEIICFVYTIQ